MNKQVLALTSFLLSASAANAQYDTLWIAPPNGMSTNLYNTTYPNSVGLAGKTHYILHFEELIDAGLQLDDVITGICMTVVDDDQTDPPCVMDIHFGIKNTTQPEFEHVDEPFNSGFIYLNELFDTTLSAGLLCFTATSPPWFLWVGPGFNLMLEFTFERGTTPGISPRILLRTDLPENRTFSLKVDYPTLGYYLLPGGPGVDAGLENSVPAVGLLVQSTTSIDGKKGSPGIVLFPSPATDLLHVRSAMPLSVVRIRDARGTLVEERSLPMPGRPLRLDGLASGVYVVEAILSDGEKCCQRFIKE